jgi:hypothetical protein
LIGAYLILIIDYLIFSKYISKFQIYPIFAAIENKREIKINFLRILNKKVQKKKICFSIHIRASSDLLAVISMD